MAPEQTDKVHEGPKTTEQILKEEAVAIHGEEKFAAARGDNLYLKLNHLDSAALCLSGGGIRSAAFALGVIQALATHPRPAPKEKVASADDSLLGRFHYLSTVSGGGYIGSWLSAWVTRVGFAKVWPNLVSRPGGPDSEPAELAWLRSYSNFLTPKIGMSPDTWAAIAIILRNLLLNWLVILPVLCVVLLVLKGIAIGTAWVGRMSPQECWPFFPPNNAFAIFALLAAALLLVGLIFRSLNRPVRSDLRAPQWAFLVFDLAPTVLAGICLTVALSPTCVHDWALGRPLFAPISGSLIETGALIGVSVYALGWLCTGWRVRRLRDHMGDAVAWVAAGAIYGSLIAVGIYLYLGLYAGKTTIFGPVEILLLVCAVPLALAAQLLAEMIFVGLTSYEHGSEEDREWLGRAAGWYLVAALGWLLLMALVYIGSSLADQLWGTVQVAVASAGGIAGLLTAFLGKSRLTSATDEAKTAKKSTFKNLIAQVAFSLSAVVFAAVLIILLSDLLDRIVLGASLVKLSTFSDPVAESGMRGLPPQLTALFWGLGLVLAIGALASYFVNINRFSLHAMYRNRLIRAFLGASHIPLRRPNPFTDLDPTDNLRMHELWPPKALWEESRNKGWQPLHVINIALNIVSTKKLAWQERKAEPFTVSPLHSGSACGKASGSEIARGTYHPSEVYGGSGGISVGTAMAVSGAAASSNMGYNPSPTLSFFLTLFNVRLGWWLGNPAKDQPRIYASEGPRVAVVPLIYEMFGQTTDERAYIYLSDGGHFENLGLYEMVRRRCRCIVLSDAGCDPDFVFEDLGNAVRKIYLDLGVKITFHGLSKLKPRPGDGSDLGDAPYHAIGVIDYNGADGSGEPGYILYIKPGYHGIESAGIRAYAKANTAFPHEGTGDQFFSESQFESYRALGFEIVDGLLTKSGSSLVPDEDLGARIAALIGLEEIARPD